MCFAFQERTLRHVTYLGTDTEIFSFRLVSRAALFQVKMRTHTTVNANGDLTAEVQDFSVDCRVH